MLNTYKFEQGSISLTNRLINAEPRETAMTAKVTIFGKNS